MDFLGSRSRPTVLETPVEAKCEGHGTCMDCILKLCIYILLYSGKRKCVNSGNVRSHIFEIKQIMGHEDECNREELIEHEFTKVPITKIKKTPPKYRQYDAALPPTVLTGRRTRIYLGLDVRNITVEWYDNRLKKKPNGMQYAFYDIWWPVIAVVKNEYGKSNYTGVIDEIQPDQRTRMITNHYGNITWSWDRYPMQLESKCDLREPSWPFGSHTCNIILTLGQRSQGNVTDLELLSKARKMALDIRLDTKKTMTPSWKVIQFKAARMDVYHECCSEPFGDLVFSFTLQRRWSFFSVFALVALILAFFINIAVLWQPMSTWFAFRMVAIYASVNLIIFFVICAGAPQGFSFAVLLAVGNISAAVIVVALGICIVKYFRARKPPQYLQHLFGNSDFLQKCLRLDDFIPTATPESIPLADLRSRIPPSNFPTPGTIMTHFQPNASLCSAASSIPTVAWGDRQIDSLSLSSQGSSPTGTEQSGSSASSEFILTKRPRATFDYQPPTTQARREAWFLSPAVSTTANTEFLRLALADHSARFRTSTKPSAADEPAPEAVAEPGPSADQDFVPETEPEAEPAFSPEPEVRPEPEVSPEPESLRSPVTTTDAGGSLSITNDATMARLVALERSTIQRAKEEWTFFATAIQRSYVVIYSTASAIITLLYLFS